MKMLAAAAVLFLVGGAHAQTADSTDGSGESKAKAPIAAPSREDIDAEITNARLRATTGAKSLVSLQTAFNYNGGSIDHPLSKERAKLSADEVGNDPAKLTGTISGKYRITDHDNLNVGIGVGWLTPTYEGQKGQVENPYVAYGRVFKTGTVQNVLNVAIQKYTAKAATENDRLNYETDIDYTFLVPLGDGKAQVGLVLAWYREFYTDYTGANQDTLAAYPFAEYEFNQTLSARTVYRGFSYYNTAADVNTFAHGEPTESAGVGISITRDFYLYPNIQWVWADIRADKTTVALSANINL